MKNKKYLPNKKNKGKPPVPTDGRVKYVSIGCQKCIECRKQKAREWQVRLLEDIKTNKNGKFITLTFSNESIKELNEIVNKIEEDVGVPIEGYDRDNRMATIAVRRFLERYRKEHGVSLRHWLITELGGQGTENIHLHGIIWTNDSLDEIEKIWKYGYMWKGKGEKKINYVNEATVNYITKYVNKIDENHKEYQGKILTSSGIGSEYPNTNNARRNKYNNNKTDETYRTRTGHRMAMPIYYRNKIYNESEREKLWIEKLDKQIRYIRGEKVDVSKGEEDYNKILEWHQRLNIELGYEDGTKIDWTRKQYEKELRKLKQSERIKKCIGVFIGK